MMTSTQGGSNLSNNWMKLRAASAFIVLLSALAHASQIEPGLDPISYKSTRCANDENEAQTIPSSSRNDTGKARKEGGGNAAQLPPVGIRLGTYPRRAT